MKKILIINPEQLVMQITDGFEQRMYDEGYIVLWGFGKAATLLNDYTVEMYEYLLSHENDIATEINDFGKLRQTFIDIFNREPK